MPETITLISMVLTAIATFGLTIIGALTLRVSIKQNKISRMQADIALKQARSTNSLIDISAQMNNIQLFKERYSIYIKLEAHFLAMAMPDQPPKISELDFLDNQELALLLFPPSIKQYMSEFSKIRAEYAANKNFAPDGEGGFIESIDESIFVELRAKMMDIWILKLRPKLLECMEVSRINTTKDIDSNIGAEVTTSEAQLKIV